MASNAPLATNPGLWIAGYALEYIEALRRRGEGLALKVLQVAGAAAVVIVVLLFIPVLVRLRRTLEEVGFVVAETRPQAITLLKKAQVTLDGVNRELENVGAITGDTAVLIARVSEASDAVERAIKSPMAKLGFVTATVTALTFAVKRRVFRDVSRRS